MYNLRVVVCKHTLIPAHFIQIENEKHVYHLNGMCVHLVDSRPNRFCHCASSTKKYRIAYMHIYQNVPGKYKISRHVGRKSLSYVHINTLCNAMRTQQSFFCQRTEYVHRIIGFVLFNFVVKILSSESETSGKLDHTANKKQQRQLESIWSEKRWRQRRQCWWWWLWRLPHSIQTYEKFRMRHVIRRQESVGCFLDMEMYEFSFQCTKYMCKHTQADNSVWLERRHPCGIRIQQ